MYTYSDSNMVYMMRNNDDYIMMMIMVIIIIVIIVIMILTVLSRSTLISRLLYTHVVPIVPICLDTMVPITI